MPNRPDRFQDNGHGKSSWAIERYVRLGIGIVGILILALVPAVAADRATCSMIVKLLETTDRGLEAAAAGNAHGATSSVAVFAQETLNMAQRHSQSAPLPDEVAAALTTILGETSTHFFIADAAPVLLEQSLLIQQAMPAICVGSDIPDLNRHLN